MSALRDDRRAEQLDPSLRGLDLAYASLVQDLGSWRTASTDVESHLERLAGDHEGLRLHAEILTSGRRFDGAARA